MSDRTRYDIRELTIKSFEEEPQAPMRLRGVASTPTEDRHGDIIEPGGATFPVEMPLLLHHQHHDPVGTARLRHVGGVLEFDAELPYVTTPGTVKTKVDQARDSIRHKLIRGVSIGFRPRGAPDDVIERRKGGGLRFLKTEILELSLVTVPANSDASFAVLKQLDTGYQAAAGRSPLPGDTGPLRSVGTMTTETLNESIRAYETSLAAKQAQIDGLLNTAKDAGRTLDATERERCDTLQSESDGIIDTISRFRAREKSALLLATPVPATANGRPAAVAAISVRPNQAPGATFTRAMMAQIACYGKNIDVAQYAAQRWPDAPDVALYVKAAVAPGTSTAAGWAAELVGATTEFIALMWPKTAIGQIQGMLKVPWGIKVPAQTGGGTYNWVGEGKPKPVTALAFTSQILPIAKVAGIIVMSKELVMSSSPSAEELARDSMIKGITKFVDQQFIDPTVAAVANVNPASITNGVTPIASVGPLSDIVAIANAFTAAGVPLEGLTYIMSPNNALVLSFQRESTGALRFPGMSADGGSVSGLKIVTSAAAGNNVIGLIPQLILYNDEGGITVDVSQEASLQMDSAPASPADATTVFVSLWQNNFIGLRAEWFISWLKANANAVKYVNNAGYTIPAPTGLEATTAGNGKTK